MGALDKYSRPMPVSQVVPRRGIEPRYPKAQDLQSRLCPSSRGVARHVGIEPTPRVLEALVLPLHQCQIFVFIV